MLSKILLDFLMLIDIVSLTLHLKSWSVELSAQNSVVQLDLCFFWQMLCPVLFIYLV